MTTTPSVLLAAGGTAGHLFPAFALAEELQRRGIIVDLATDLRGDRYGQDFPARDIYKIPSATVRGRSPIELSKTGLTLVRGIVHAHRLIGRVRPRAVIGFGGYPTFPPLIAARMRGIKTAIHEQNAVLGRANKMLARRVDYIATTFADTKLLPPGAEAKVRVTGNPIRAAVAEAAQTPYPDLTTSGPLHIVVFGGSQGARYLSDAVPAAFAQLGPELRARLAVHQQAREEDVDRVIDVYKHAGIRATVASFFADLPGLIANAHLVIARSGASTVAEIAVIGRPAILVPLPGSLDNDQLENARQLAVSGAAWCIEQKNLTVDRISDEISALASQPERLAAAARAAKSVGKPAAAVALAELVSNMVHGGNV